MPSDPITGYARAYAKHAADVVDDLLLDRGITTKRDPELTWDIELKLTPLFERARRAHEPD
jgi:hypothetical protein